VEEGLNMKLNEFREYFDEEMMRILGQMDAPSQILDFLYLGSEWNASNLEELQKLK
jgi:protein phosphatase slingshot